MTTTELTDYLRHRVLGLLHVNLLGPGDRLSSIREVSTLLDADHRAVADAYRQLEKEGLVEIRPASGVYVAAEAGASAAVGATTWWLTDVLTTGWSQRIDRKQLGWMIERCANQRIRCACVESVRDTMVAISAELEADFDLEVEEAYLEPEGKNAAHIPDAIRRADLVVTSQFHAEKVRPMAAMAGKPLVVVTVHPELAGRVDAILREGPVIAVVSDPAMVDRMRAYLAVTAHKDAVEPVLSGGIATMEDVENRGRRVLATRAARRDLGADDFHLLPAPPTFISPASARALFELIVQIALQDQFETAGGADLAGLSPSAGRDPSS